MKYRNTKEFPRLFERISLHGNMQSRKLTTWHHNRILDECEQDGVFGRAESHERVLFQSRRDVNVSQCLRGLDHHPGVCHRTVAEILPELGNAGVKDAVFFGGRGDGRVGGRPARSPGSTP